MVSGEGDVVFPVLRGALLGFDALGGGVDAEGEGGGGVVELRDDGGAGGVVEGKEAGFRR